MLLLVVGLIGAILGGVIASKKNRSVPAWVLLGGLLPISIVLMFILKPLDAKPAPHAE